MADQRSPNGLAAEPCSTPHIAGLLPEHLDDPHGSPSSPAELGRIREEQRRLRRRQDELEQTLREKAHDGDTANKDKDKQERNGPASARGNDHDEGEDKPKDEQAPKPPLLARLRESARKHPVRAALIALGVVAALVGGLIFYLHTLTYEDTDDAEVDGDISAVSPRISGTVTAVHVVDNQVVRAGDPIADLDPRDYDVAVSQARAGLEQAEAQLTAEKPNVPITAVSNRTTIATSSEDVATARAELATAERDLAQSQARIIQAEANARYAQVESQRSAYLASVGAVAPSELDQRASTADATAAAMLAQREAAEAAQKRIEEQRAKLASAEQRLDEARKNAPQQLEAREAGVKLREAAIVAARAQLEQAALNRSYAQIVAPVDGIVGSKSVDVGDRVQPGQTLAGITQTSRLWITANFRETQLRKMHAGQPVRIHVDALDRDFTGQVESMPGATGSRYSLLPPENATGNYVKVVQRLPVRISLDPGQDGFDRLRPGMSVEPTVTLK
jgi:membrane fusion protein (multidrug efflux system)